MVRHYIILALIWHLFVILETCSLMKNTQLKLGTFNCKGHGEDRIQYVKKVMCQCDILLLQEHWYSNADLNRLEAQLEDISVIGISGMDDDKILVGRPYGGLAILCNHSLNCTVTPICNDNKRCFACILSLNNTTRILLANVYMPCDVEYDRESQQKFLDILSTIDLIIETQTDIDHIIVGGDWNTDFRRTNSSHTSALISFCNRTNLLPGISHSCANVDYTYENVATGSESVLDHFLISENMYSNIIEYFSIHEGDNLSDHSPVIMGLDTLCQQTGTEPRRFESKCSWAIATDADKLKYKNTLEILLRVIKIPHDALGCRDVNCVKHNNAISKYHNDIIHACISASTECIPVGKRKKLAGWSEHVKDYKSRSILWHKIWSENGRPKEGLLWNIMTKSKMEYKKMSKWVVKNQEQLSSERMANALQGNESRDFWNEVKRKNKKPQSSPTVVDGIHGCKEIGEVFRQKYEDLYNCVSYDQHEMDELYEGISESIKSSCIEGKCYSNHNVSVEEVRKGCT